MRAAGGRSTGTAGSARGYDTLKRIEDARRRRDDRTAGGDAGRARIRMYAASRLLDRRVVDDAQPALATDDESDRDAPVAHAVHEIDRAVDRVDHPQVTPDLPAALLGEQRFAGKLGAEPLHDQRFDRVIGGAHEVLRALGFRDEADLATKVAPRERAGFACERLHEPDPLDHLARTHPLAASQVARHPAAATILRCRPRRDR